MKSGKTDWKKSTSSQNDLKHHPEYKTNNNTVKENHHASNSERFARLQKLQDNQ